MKHKLLIGLCIYLGLSLIIALFRAMPEREYVGNGQYEVFNGCRHLYLDYFMPLSLLGCEVGKVGLK